METGSTGILYKNKEYYLRSKGKGQKTYDLSRHSICQNSKKEDLQSIMSNMQLNCLKVDFQKVNQHTGGKWLIHDIKRRKDNLLQRLKLPCRISNLSS